MGKITPNSIIIKPTNQGAPASIRSTWSKTAEFGKRFFTGSLGALPLFLAITLVRSSGGMPSAARCYQLGLYTSGIGLLSASVTSHPKKSFYRGMQLSAVAAAGTLIFERMSRKMADSSESTQPPASQPTTMSESTQPPAPQPTTMSESTQSPEPRSTTSMATCNEYDHPAWHLDQYMCPILTIPYEQLKLHSFNNITVWASSCLKRDKKSGDFTLKQAPSDLSGMTSGFSPNSKFSCMFREIESSNRFVLECN